MEDFHHQDYAVPCLFLTWLTSPAFICNTKTHPGSSHFQSTCQSAGRVPSSLLPFILPVFLMHLLVIVKVSCRLPCTSVLSFLCPVVPQVTPLHKFTCQHISPSLFLASGRPPPNDRPAYQEAFGHTFLTTQMLQAHHWEEVS